MKQEVSAPQNMAVQKSTQEIAKAVLPAVVLITVKDADGNLLATGSGFFISLKKVYKAAYIGDATHDLAILECPDATDVPILALSNSEKVEIGE